jgi:RimJ/RimL family protein N-acetyltransferase
MLETKRIIIRPIEPKDKNEVFACRSDKETNKYQGWIPENIKEVEEFISNNPSVFNTPKTWFQLVIIEKESNKIIGDVGIHFIDQENFQCEVGCTINKDYQKKGFAFEALNLVINHLFTNLNKHRIIASVDPRNISSIKLIEKLGFRKEAHFIKSYYQNGEWCDDVIYALLKEEWI